MVRLKSSTGHLVDFNRQESKFSGLCDRIINDPKFDSTIIPVHVDTATLEKLKEYCSDRVGCPVPTMSYTDNGTPIMSNYPESRKLADGDFIIPKKHSYEKVFQGASYLEIQGLMYFYLKLLVVEGPEVFGRSDDELRTAIHKVVYED